MYYMKIYQSPCFSEHRSNSTNTHQGQIFFPIIIRKLILRLPRLSFLGGRHFPVSHTPSTHLSSSFFERLWWIWVRPVLELLILFLSCETHKTIRNSWIEQRGGGLLQTNMGCVVACAVHITERFGMFVNQLWLHRSTEWQCMFVCSMFFSGGYPSPYCLHFFKSC